MKDQNSSTWRHRRQLVVEIDDAIRRYKTAPNVSDKERLANLMQIRDRASQLCAALDSLAADPNATSSIVGLTPSAVHPIDLNQQLRHFIAQTEYAISKARKPRQGPSGLDPLRRLVHELAILWTLEHPETPKGITAVKGERRGPMLDFVWKRLKRAGIRVQSRESLGKMLYSMRHLIAQHAARSRDKRVISRKMGRVTITSLE